MREGLPAAMPNARKGKGSKPAPRETKFEPDEMPALYGAICRLDPVRRDAWLFALMTGQRASIVESLQWSDVNLAERTLTVAAEREGNKGAFTYTVALSAAVVNLLERRRDENEMMFGETAYVFPSNRPGRVHIDLRSEYSLPVPRRYTAQLAKAGAAWGGNACQVHAMRHTFTERALDDLGISEHDVRKLVGQKPVQGALASYVGADATSPRHREVVERISAHLLACMGLSPDHRFKAIDPEQRAA
jgi:integrase